MSNNINSYLLLMMMCCGILLFWA